MWLEAASAAATATSGSASASPDWVPVATFWIAATTLLAVAASAFATVVLAVKTGNLARSTEQMAKASVDGIGLQREELEAVKKELQHATEQLQLARDQFELTAKVAAQQLKQAEATAAMAAEMQRERELAVRPYLTVELLRPPYLDEIVVHNVGRGPALNCVWTYIGNPATSWRRSKVFHVAPGSGRQLRVTADMMLSQQGEPIPTPIWDYGQLDEQGAHHVADVHALFCQDETGRRLYRFIDGRIGYDVWEGEPSQPPWATFVLQLHPGFRPGRETTA